jgi:hypothetical protein
MVSNYKKGYYMKQIVIEVLKKAINRSAIKNGKKTIKTESELLSINTKSLMKLYNNVMKEYNFNIADICERYGQSLTDDEFREYMIDKLYDTYEKTDVLYDPEIEDEMYMADYVLSYSDGQIAQIYNHNMFDHNFINFKP